MDEINCLNCMTDVQSTFPYFCKPDDWEIPEDMKMIEKRIINNLLKKTYGRAPRA